MLRRRTHPRLAVNLKDGHPVRQAAELGDRQAGVDQERPLCRRGSEPTLSDAHTGEKPAWTRPGPRSSSATASHARRSRQAGPARAYAKPSSMLAKSAPVEEVGRMDGMPAARRSSANARNPVGQPLLNVMEQQDVSHVCSLLIEKYWINRECWFIGPWRDNPRTTSWPIGWPRRLGAGHRHRTPDAQ